MSTGTQKNRIPRYIEPRRFVQQGVHLVGEIPPDSFRRLSQSVSGVKQVVADLTFELVEKSAMHKVVSGTIEAQVAMQCQRCLEDVLLSLECNVNLALVWSESEAEGLPEAFDPWIVAEEEADLLQVVEDEILLNLPYVAMHEQACVDRKLFHSESDEGGSEVSSQAPKANPFQVLAKLKHKTNK